MSQDPKRLVMIRCRKSQLTDLIKAGKAEGLLFNSRRTEMYIALLGSTVVGMCGVIWDRDKVIMKNAYILSEYRRRGYLRQMLDFRIRLAQVKGIDTVEATVTELALPEYLHRGAEVIQRHRVSTKVRFVIGAAP